MIGSLRGQLLDRGEDEVLVEVAGVGYRVKVSPAAAVSLGDVGDDVFVHIHHHIREADEALYGFPTKEERVAFEALLGAHGVGPALAQAILSIHDPVALHHVLATDDVSALCLVPGVGKKTAQRLLVELKSRLDLPDVDLTVARTAEQIEPAMIARADVRQALTDLGYGNEQIATVLKDLPEGDDAGELLRQALQKIAG